MVEIHHVYCIQFYNCIHILYIVGLLVGLFAGWMGIIPILETAINGNMHMGTLITLITPC